MKEIEPKIGNRFGDGHGLWWELIKILPGPTNLYMSETGKKKKMDDRWIRYGWKFIGNFSKSTQAIDFYERIK